MVRSNSANGVTRAGGIRDVRKILRWAGYAAATLIILVFVAFGAIWLLAGQKLAGASAAPVRLATPTPDQLADAPRMLVVLRCEGCHNKDLRGSLYFDEPHVAK